MGQNLYDNYEASRKIYDEANKILDWDVQEVCFADKNGIINQTRYTQAALFTTTIATYNAVVESGIKPDAVAGFSLGEYSALVASGILTFQDALKIVDLRAEFMDKAATNQPGKMSAVIGIGADVVSEVCATLASQGKIVTLANDNCVGQVVISGQADAVGEASTILTEKGARRVVPLAVSGAFHSPLMETAADSLKEKLSQFEFSDPKIPIISNVTADYMTSKEQVITYIPEQIIMGVRFRETLNRLINDGFDTFIEVGVKKTLCGFVSKTSKEVNVYNIEDKASLEKTIKMLEGR
ncbi:MAG: [acyl-carrier-protein] S-malonyltransferase [Epulopiscium sp. Nele67-Bin004]|nr:MAG: [acyl-carrier-protein] S-malonyltransferase [Epulopiscium sp. Nele67-Bin004]